MSVLLAIKRSTSSTTLRCRRSARKRRDAAANIGFIKPEQ
jgi:hypothetical protein